MQLQGGKSRGSGDVTRCFSGKGLDLFPHDRDTPLVRRIQLEDSGTKEIRPVSVSRMPCRICAAQS